MTFDMCGLICGYYDFKIHEFLIPTIIGKSTIKAPCQSIVVLYLYYNNQQYKTFNSNKYILSIWYSIIYILILYFIKSSLESIAKIQLDKINKLDKN